MSEHNRQSDPIFENQITELLTTEQVASRLNVAVKTVRKWRYEGRLPAVKVGKRLVRYKWGSVLEWLKTNGV